MLSYKHYVPVLRWKQAEWMALRMLNTQTKTAITPIVEPTPKKFSSYNRETTVKIGEEIHKSWGDNPFFLDIHLLPSMVHVHFLNDIVPLCANMGLHVIPVTRLSHNEQLQRLFSRFISNTDTEICFRLTRDEISNQGFRNRLTNLLSLLGVSPQQVHLIVDCQLVLDSTENVTALFNSLPNLNEWRTFTVLGGAFPQDLSGFRPGICSQTRNDWIVWSRCIATIDNHHRKPSFGDYTIQHPIYTEPPERANYSASIRYTSYDKWIIMRGEGVFNDNGPGFAQYPANAQLLCLQTEFCGKDFSEGDKYIHDIGQQQNMTGSARTWLTAGINHHLVFVTRQISSLSAT